MHIQIIYFHGKWKNCDLFQQKYLFYSSNDWNDPQNKRTKSNNYDMSGHKTTNEDQYIIIQQRATSYFSKQQESKEKRLLCWHKQSNKHEQTAINSANCAVYGTRRRVDDDKKIL